MSLEDLVSKAKDLPPNPDILPKLLDKLSDPDSTNWEIAKLINYDQTLTSQVLTWSNSGFYGYVEPSASIEEAIQRVGMREIYKLVGIIMGKRLTEQPVNFYGLQGGELWENSLGGAFAMEALATHLGDCDLNVAYTAGLLHGIGKIVIGQACENSYQDVFDCVEAEKIPLIQAEKKIIGYNHAEVGEYLLKNWRFPSVIYDSIGKQYTPSKAVFSNRLAQMLNLMHYVISGIGYNHGKDSLAFTLEPGIKEALSLSDTKLQMIFIESRTRLEDVKDQLAQNQTM